MDTTKHEFLHVADKTRLEKEIGSENLKSVETLLVFINYRQAATILKAQDKPVWIEFSEPGWLTLDQIYHPAICPFRPLNAISEKTARRTMTKVRKKYFPHHSVLEQRHKHEGGQLEFDVYKKRVKGNWAAVPKSGSGYRLRRDAKTWKKLYHAFHDLGILHEFTNSDYFRDLHGTVGTEMVEGFYEMVTPNSRERVRTAFDALDLDSPHPLFLLYLVSPKRAQWSLKEAINWVKNDYSENLVGNSDFAEAALDFSQTLGMLAAKGIKAHYKGNYPSWRDATTRI